MTQNTLTPAPEPSISISSSANTPKQEHVHFEVDVIPAGPGDAYRLAQIQYEALAQYDPLYSAFFLIDPDDPSHLPRHIAATQNRPNTYLMKACQVLSSSSSEKIYGETVGFARWTVCNVKPDHRIDFIPGYDNSGARRVHGETQIQNVKSTGPRTQADDDDDSDDIYHNGSNSPVHGEYKSTKQDEDVHIKVRERLRPILHPRPGLEPLFADLTVEKDKEMERFRFTTMRHHVYIFLEHLFVSPTHQRKGIGQKLFSYGLERADALNLPTYLNASEAGYPLYLKNGFVELHKWETNLEYWARKVIDKQKELGFRDVDEILVEKTRGKVEMEYCMVRWAKYRSSVDRFSRKMFRLAVDKIRGEEQRREPSPAVFGRKFNMHSN